MLNTRTTAGIPPLLQQKLLLYISFFYTTELLLLFFRGLWPNLFIKEAKQRIDEAVEGFDVGQVADIFQLYQP